MDDTLDHRTKVRKGCTEGPDKVVHDNRCWVEAEEPHSPTNRKTEHRVVHAMEDGVVEDENLSGLVLREVEQLAEVERRTDHENAFPEENPPWLDSAHHQE